MNFDAVQVEYSSRPFLASDADFVVHAHTLPHVRPFVAGAPAQEQVIAAIGRPDLIERIVLDGDGQPAGLWRARVLDGWLVELMLVIATEPRHGAGRFAVRDAKRYAFEDIGAHRLCLEVTSANAAARALYESEGFVHEGTFRDGFRDADGKFEDLAHYGMLISEYRA